MLEYCTFLTDKENFEGAPKVIFVCQYTPRVDIVSNTEESQLNNVYKRALQLKRKCL